MKLFYYQRPDKQPNFGDELNYWLWPQLAPSLFKKDDLPPEDSTTFIGTGTLLNSKLPERVKGAKWLVVFSTGAGYEQPLKHIPTTWQICCVRGPLSAKQLNLPPEKAITDGGILVAKVFTAQPSTAERSISFMPHIHSANAASESWQRICEKANLRYIDPRWPVEEVLQAIGSSSLLLAEAMHGAITADTLRVPWIPVITTPRIYTFKWQDWCASMELTYHPKRLPTLTDYPRWGRGIRSGTVAAQHLLGAGMGNGLTGVLRTLQYSLLKKEDAIIRVTETISKQQPCLSDDYLFQQRLSAIEACFGQLTNT